MRGWYGTGQWLRQSSAPLPLGLLARVRSTYSVPLPLSTRMRGTLGKGSTASQLWRRYFISAPLVLRGGVLPVLSSGVGTPFGSSEYFGEMSCHFPVVAWVPYFASGSTRCTCMQVNVVGDICCIRHIYMRCYRVVGAMYKHLLSHYMCS